MTFPDAYYTQPEAPERSRTPRKPMKPRNRVILIVAIVVAAVVLVPVGLYFVVTSPHPKAVILNNEFERVGYKDWGSIHGSSIEANRDIDLFADEADRNYQNLVDYDGDVMATVVHGFRSYGYTCKNTSDGPWNQSYYCFGSHGGHEFGATINIVQDLLDEINPPGNTDVFFAS